jgi:hypothetical protein
MTAAPIRRVFLASATAACLKNAARKPLGWRWSRRGVCQPGRALVRRRDPVARRGGRPAEAAGVELGNAVLAGRLGGSANCGGRMALYRVMLERVSRPAFGLADGAEYAANPRRVRGRDWFVPVCGGVDISPAVSDRPPPTTPRKPPRSSHSPATPESSVQFDPDGGAGGSAARPANCVSPGFSTRCRSELTDECTSARSAIAGLTNKRNVNGRSDESDGRISCRDESSDSSQ